MRAVYGEWRDVLPGGRPLPNSVRFLYVALAFGVGAVIGELVLAML